MIPIKVYHNGKELKDNGNTNFEIWYGKSYEEKIKITNTTNNTLKDFIVQTIPKLNMSRPHDLAPKESQEITITLDGTQLWNDDITKSKLHIRCTEVKINNSGE